MSQFLQRWLGGSRLFWVLVGLNVLVTLALVAVTFHLQSPDEPIYLRYASGLQQGRYSSWYFFPDYLPDTFRNPGYPIFLYLLELIGAGPSGIKVVQVLLYGATVALAVRLADRCEQPYSWLVRNIFLLLLLPNVQLAYFAALIYPEMLVAFLLLVYATVAITWPLGTWRRTLALALIAGTLFQVRPVFLFFPLVQLGLDYWQARQVFAWRQALVLLGLYGATMLPYAAWNHKYNGTWKPTSLEGGAGVMHLGFWALRLPGYVDNHYWNTHMGDEVVQFVPADAVPANIAAYRREWDAIEAQTVPLLTARDKHYGPIMHRGNDLLFPTYSAAYTLGREHALMQTTLADIRREPGYYLETRLYTAVRLWITGVQRDAWAAATSPVAKIKVLYPTLVSGLTFVLALLAIGWAALRRQLSCLPTWRLSVALALYFGLLHVPFAIQARYTVPVRPLLLLAIALSLAAWLTRRTPANSLELETNCGPALQ